MEDAAGFGEINDEQAQAVLRQLKICGEHLQAARGKEAQLKRALGDYEELRQTLQSLPERVEHRVMVPFGKMAFFPGSLRHTNEITVLLGDNYFALRSAAQAEGIAERRADFVRPQLDEAKEEVAELERTREKLRAIGALHAEQQGTFEIREEYVEEEWAAKAAARAAPPPAPAAAAGGGKKVQFANPPKPASSSPAFVAPTDVIGERVVERTPTAAEVPTDAQIEHRELEREYHALRQRRAAAEAAAAAHAAPAAPPPDDSGAEPRVSRFKAARMRSRGCGGPDG